MEVVKYNNEYCLATLADDHFLEPSYLVHRYNERKMYYTSND